jgi:histone H3/H4
VSPKDKAARDYVDQLRFNDALALINDACEAGILAEADKSRMITDKAPIAAFLKHLADAVGEQSAIPTKFADSFPLPLQSGVITRLAAVVNHYATDLVADAVAFAVRAEGTATSNKKNSKFDCAHILHAAGMPSNAVIGASLAGAEEFARRRHENAHASPADTENDDDGESDEVPGATAALSTASFDKVNSLKNTLKKVFLPQAADTKWIVMADTVNALLFLIDNLHHRILSGAYIVAKLSARKTIHSDDVVLSAARIISNVHSVSTGEGIATVQRLVEEYGDGPRKHRSAPNGATEASANITDPNAAAPSAPKRNAARPVERTSPARSIAPKPRRTARASALVA